MSIRLSSRRAYRALIHTVGKGSASRAPGVSGPAARLAVRLERGQEWAWFTRLCMLSLASLCALVALSALTSASASATLTHQFLPGVTAKLSEAEPLPVTGPLFEQVKSMTVDGGELYVAEGSETSRTDKFNAASGAFLSQLPQLPLPKYLHQGVVAGHSTGETQLYVAGDEYPEGSPRGAVAVLSPAGNLLGVWTGPEPSNPPNGFFDCFECAGPASIAVDGSSSLGDWASGDVYVVDRENKVVDVFKPKAGGGEEYVTALTGPEPPGVLFPEPISVAVNQSTGEVVVSDSENVVDLFRPAAITGQYEFLGKLAGPGSGGTFNTIADVAIDGGSGSASGDIYVAEGANPAVVDEFNSKGEYVGHLTGTPEGSSGGVQSFSSVASVAVDPQSHDVYVNDYRNEEREPSVVDVFGPDIVIPDVVTGTVTAEKAIGGGQLEATLNGTVNPNNEGAASCQFVWGTTRELGQVAPCQPTQVANGSSTVPVHATLSGDLQPDTTYYYRLQATNKNGTNTGEPSQDGEFTTLGPGLREESASKVAATSVTLDATINPHNRPTSYYFQYGTSTGYESQSPLGQGISIGLEGANVEVSQHLQDLLAGTVYHYRVVAVSELPSGGLEAFHGPDKTFTTQTAGAVELPDGRTWELVSPAEKHGAVISPISESGLAQASASGTAMTYLTYSPTELEPPGYTNGVQVLSLRGTGGWSSKDISVPHAVATGPSVGNGQEYRFFSEDLSLGVLQPFGRFDPALSPEASEQTAYLRTNYLNGDVDQPCLPTAMHCYRPLVTGAAGYEDVSPGEIFGEESCTSLRCGPQFLGASPDSSHLVLESNTPLMTGAGDHQLYEWTGGKLTQVSVLPDGEKSENGPQLGFGNSSMRHAISDNGSRVVWREGGVGGHLYMRDTETSETVQLDVIQGGSGSGEPLPIYQIASNDGSRVFFTEAKQHLAHGSGFGDLYECEIVEVAGKSQCKLSDLTPLYAGKNAEVSEVLGASEDGAYVYFAAAGALAPGAKPGKCGGNSPQVSETQLCNLYVWHDGTTSLIAGLSQEDYPDWGSVLGGLTARVSPDGRWLAFMSQRELTGYVTRDAVSGKPDEEVYLYDESSGRTVCASCNPSGGRPAGVEYGELGRLVGGDRVWNQNDWIAANIPGYTPYSLGQDLYQSRYLSNSGRLFFNSNDALVPQDVDGTEDVYQYEPPGAGNCDESAVTFSERSGGCVGLISSGSSPEESAFLDASESGRDVFFLTVAKLLTQDFDTSLDVYDAHECTSASPCFVPPPVQPPQCDTGDSCKPSPTPQPVIFGSPSSATFSGAGNVASASTPSVKPKVLTRAQKLARALQTCQKKRKKKLRAACEQQAKKRYAARQSGKAKATKKGRG